jgi:hypothetical protein
LIFFLLFLLTGKFFTVLFCLLQAASKVQAARSLPHCYMLIIFTSNANDFYFAATQSDTAVLIENCHLTATELALDNELSTTSAVLECESSLRQPNLPETTNPAQRHT